MLLKTCKTDFQKYALKIIFFDNVI